MALAVRTFLERKRPRDHCAEDAWLHRPAAYQVEAEAEAKATRAPGAPAGTGHLSPELPQEPHGPSRGRPAWGRSPNSVSEDLIPILTSQQKDDTNERARLERWIQPILLKVKCESFSTFNKNVFSFEALEVLSHIFFLIPPPRLKCLKTHGLTVAAQKIYTLKV